MQSKYDDTLLLTKGNINVDPPRLPGNDMYNTCLGDKYHPVVKIMYFTINVSFPFPIIMFKNVIGWLNFKGRDVD